MEKRIEAYLGKPLPRWVKYTALVFGITMISVSMGRLLTDGLARHVWIPMITGSLLIYISGFEKRLWIDDMGVTRTLSFWGYRNEENVSWKDITDARVILNKGRRLYVLLHGTKKIWPLTYRFDQTQEVLAFLRGQLGDAALKIEQ